MEYIREKTEKTWSEPDEINSREPVKTRSHLSEQMYLH